MRKWLALIISFQLTLCAQEYSDYGTISFEEIICCLEQHGIWHAEHFERLSPQRKYLLAQDILYLHNGLVSYLQPVGYTDFLAGSVLVVAGLLLVRYPPPARTIGISLITSGLTMVGSEYLKDFIQYLMDKGMIQDKDREKLEEFYDQRIIY